MHSLFLFYLTGSADKFLASRFSVVGKIATSLVNPLVFTFLREAISGPVLVAGAMVLERPNNLSGATARDIGMFVLLGCMIWTNQFLYIMGISISGAIVGSVLQPAAPVFTTLIAILFKIEPPSVLKVLFRIP